MNSNLALVVYASAVSNSSDASKFIPSTLSFFEQWDALCDAERSAKDAIKALSPKAFIVRQKKALKTLEGGGYDEDTIKRIQVRLYDQEQELKADYQAAVKQLRVIKAAKVAYKAYLKYVK